MKGEFWKDINVKKIGNISLLVSAVVITYYALSTYKTYLEIKDLKNSNIGYHICRQYCSHFLSLL
jgi:hypothetical protein